MKQEKKTEHTKKTVPKESKQPTKTKGALTQMAKSLSLTDVHAKYDLPMNQYGALIEKVMLERGVSIKDLAAELRCSYEHVRQVVHGGRSVSPMMNRAICAFFGLDEEEMNNTAKRDQMIAQFGSIMQDTKQKDAILQSIENGWPLLTEKQRELIAENVSRFTYQNRAHSVFKKTN